MRMRVLAAVVFVLSCHLFSSTSQADWNAKAFDYGSTAFKGFPGPRGLGPAATGSIATVWGGSLRKIKMNENISHDMRMASLPVYFEKDVKVYLRPTNKTVLVHGKPVRAVAPLMVFVPGVFSDGDAPMAKGMIDWLSEMGYNVLTIPNAWSKEYHTALPFHKSEFPNDEADTIVELARWAVKELGEKNVSTVYLAGESLGALTAAIAYEKDSNATEPIFNGGVTLMWPPIKLTSAVDTLDDMILSTDDIYKSKCHPLMRQVKTAYRVLKGYYISGPTATDIMCAPALVAQFSFREELVKLAKKIVEVRKRDLKVPSDLTFHSFIKEFAERYEPSLDPNDQRGYLGYWIKQMNPASLDRLQIISSSDDFLNAQESWRDVKAAGLSDKQLLLLNWGGHIGATNTAEFKNLIKLQYAQPKTAPKPAPQPLASL